MNRKHLFLAVLISSLVSMEASAQRATGPAAQGPMIGNSGIAGGSAAAYEPWRSEFRRFLAAPGYDGVAMASLLTLYRAPGVDQGALLQGMEAAIEAKLGLAMAAIQDKEASYSAKLDAYNLLHAFEVEMPGVLERLPEGKVKAGVKAAGAASLNWLLDWSAGAIEDGAKAFDHGKAPQDAPAWIEPYDAAALEAKDIARVEGEVSLYSRRIGTGNAILRRDVRAMARLVKSNPDYPSLGRLAVEQLMTRPYLQATDPWVYRSLIDAGLPESAQLLLVKNAVESATPAFLRSLQRMALASKSAEVKREAYAAFMKEAKRLGDYGLKDETRAAERWAAEIYGAMKTSQPSTYRTLEWVKGATALAAAATAISAWVVMCAGVLGGMSLEGILLALFTFLVSGSSIVLLTELDSAD